MSKHTPGPWEFADSWVQTAKHKMPIANMNFAAANAANARLIAAAPELLSALRGLCELEADGMQASESAIEYWERARAAIKKATEEA